MITESIERLAEIETPANPFPGLRPFEFHESHLFFGREGQSDRLTDKLSRSRFLAVVGTSGSGKSSLVRAGLLPALCGGVMRSAGSNWRIAVMRPGNDPVGNLARALNSEDVFGSEDEQNRAIQVAVTEATLRRGSLGLVEAVRQANLPAGENLLVVADQFEELFRAEPGAKTEERENDRAAFVKLLLEPARQYRLAQEQPKAGAAQAEEERGQGAAIYVVLTMRSDYLGDCAQFRDLPEAINDSQYLIPRLTREERRAAIIGPVKVGGAEITPRLVNRLLNDVGDNPDQLPVLQHALMRTWDKWREEGREREPVDLSHYEAIGGMAEALSLHADEAYNELSGARQQLAEQIFKALTEKEADNREVRRPLTLHEVCAVTEADAQDVIAVVETFRRPGRSFLTPPAEVALAADSLIDISHESLIRNWKRLREWVEDEARCARIYRRLAETAVLYRADEAGLWHDPDLQIALNWRERIGPNEAWARRYHPAFDEAMSFLEESRAARDTEKLEKESQRRRELRRTRIFVVILAAAFLVSLASAAYAWHQQRLALEQRNAAEAARQSALIASCFAEEARNDAEEKRKEAEKAKKDASDQAQEAEQRRREAEEAKRLAEEQRQFALNQKNLAEERGRANRYLLYDANMNLAQRAFDEGNYSRGQELLDAFLPLSNPGESEPDDVRSFFWHYLWRRYHNEKATLKGNGGAVTFVAFSPDGKTLASAGADGAIRLWDWQSKQQLAVLEQPQQQRRAEAPPTVTLAAFSPDGETLASVSKDSVTLWDLRQGRLLRRLAPSPGIQIIALAFSSHSKTLTTLSADGVVKLWDGQAIREIGGAAKSETLLTAAAFSHDGDKMVGVNDKVVRVWDLRSGRELASSSLGLTDIITIVFSRDGKTLAFVNSSGSASLGNWQDTQLHQDFLELSRESRSGRVGITSAAFSPDGKTLATASSEGILKLWDVKSRQALATLRGHRDAVTFVAFSPDGRRLASASKDGTLRLWDAGSRWESAEITGSVGPLAFSPDGKTLAIAGKNCTARLWEIGTEWRWPGSKGYADCPLAFTPDGGRLVMGRSDGVVTLWDGRGGALFPLSGHKGRVTAVASSPDGRTIASAGADGTVRLWDIQTRQEVISLKGHGVRKQKPPNPDIPYAVTAVAFSLDGRMLVSAGEDRMINLWDVAGKKQLHKFGECKADEHEAEVTAVAVSPDGKILASASNDHTIKLWDLQGKQKVVTLMGHEERVHSVAFSPDGKTLASGSRDGTIKLWNVMSKQELATLKGHTADIFSIAFSRDGRTLASASRDGTIRLWFAASDEAVATQRSK